MLQPYFVTPYCIILPFKAVKSKRWIKRQSVMLTRDRVDIADWHQLTLLLRSAL
ncbi:MAG: hypothetical protein GY821_17400 [Gammaproteobacteria bacterium]|nr:hypothetical protein [Gammaproteobacteria bacterium]